MTDLDDMPDLPAGASWADRLAWERDAFERLEKIALGVAEDVAAVRAGLIQQADRVEGFAGTLQKSGSGAALSRSFSDVGADLRKTAAAYNPEMMSALAERFATLARQPIPLPLASMSAAGNA